MRLSVPEANPGLYLPLSLAVTFPFNISLGIPLWNDPYNLDTFQLVICGTYLKMALIHKIVIKLLSIHTIIRYGK